MAHWHDLFPQRIFSLHYESLVANTESESLKLLEFCDLPWQQACLDFHHNESPSMTASLAQVRQPIYASSVAHWKHYSKELKPLRELLLSAGVRLD